jgi:hypothetical protein
MALLPTQTAEVVDMKTLHNFRDDDDNDDDDDDDSLAYIS